VILAENGKEAVDVYRAERERIDLVLLDLTMPEISGKEALKMLRAIDDRVRVILMSGYSSDAVSKSATEAVLGFVQKPFPPKELAAAVRAALDFCRAAAATAT